MERYTQDLSLLVKQIELLEEQQQKHYFFYNLFSPDPNPYNKAFEEIIEYLICSSEATFLIHHFEDFSHTLSIQQQKQFQKLNDYYLRHQFSTHCFHKPYSEALYTLTAMWIKGLRGESIINLFPHLNLLREFFHLKYQKQLNMNEVKYIDVLKSIYGVELTEFYYQHIKESKASFLRLYRDYIETFPSEYIPIQHLHLSKEETMSVLYDIIRIAQSVISKQSILINFGPNPFPTIYQNEETIYLNLGIFTDFVSALNQCLKLLGEVFILDYNHSAITDDKSEAEQRFMKHSIIGFCTLLPLLTDSLTKVIVNRIFPDNKGDSAFLEKIHEELTFHYFKTNKINNSIESYQPLQEMLKYFIELEIEEEWFDKKFDSLDLSHQWNLRIEQYLNKTPHSHVEGVLRHSNWTKGEIGVAFGKLSGYFSIFCSGLPKEPYDHPFSEFLEHFSGGKLRWWRPNYQLYSKLKMNEESYKCCWVFFKQKINHFR